MTWRTRGEKAVSHTNLLLPEGSPMNDLSMRLYASEQDALNAGIVLAAGHHLRVMRITRGGTKFHFRWNAWRPLDQLEMLLVKCKAHVEVSPMGQGFAVLIRPGARLRQEQAEVVTPS